jgi:uncharacterized membrane protein YdjX (TVP38/TMEM64 family)
LLGILLFSFGLNMIPFASPSNLLIASNAALLVNVDPLTIGLLVALGSTCAKLIHYAVTFFIGKHLSEERAQKLGAAASKLKRWEFPAVFIAAATPIPDEPVVVPLGLMRYSPAKFALAFFSGKLLVAVSGALLGNVSESFLNDTVDQWILPACSVALTIAVTVILLKLDLSRTAEKILKKLGIR